ncbi:FG-GAP-like repeat-containing protein [Gaetbulibacter aestuarii]|uniref:FG-GAP-like repeat-containing protein n=1 Tax=Gaetbulibacter aestuarii TaxID=1502358 RepID=A0ABW7MVR8_9FLAO
MSTTIRLLLVFIAFFCFQFCAKNDDTPQANFLFQELSHNKSHVDFKNTLKEDAQHNIINYIYFYNGGGVSAGDINNDGLPDLFFISNQNENKLYLNKGHLEFEDITKKANVGGNADWNTGSTMVDINGDGYLDIYVCAVSGLLDFKGHNELYINNGNGTFTEQSKAYGLDIKAYSTHSYFFDYDKDGDLDCYIVNHAIHTIHSHGEAAVRNKRVPYVGDLLLENNNGHFEDVSEKAHIYGGINGYGLSASIADFNNDGWDDIYVCNDFQEEDYYYLNNQDGTFRESLGKAFSTISHFSMGSDASDINGDGYQDLIALDMLPRDEKVIKETEGDDAMYTTFQDLRDKGYKDQYSRNMLQMNKKGQYFTEDALFNGVEDTDWSWTPLLADFNNDGYQDLFISNGIKRRPNDMDFTKYVANSFKKENSTDYLYKSIDKMPSGKVPNNIFKGNGQKFTDETGEWMAATPSLSNGATYADLDLDGDLDIVTNNVDDYATIYENTSSGGEHYLGLKLKYKAMNTFGLGSKVIVYSGEKEQFKQLYSSRGFSSSTPARLHFGLGVSKSIDSLKIIWPNNSYQIETNPKIDTTQTIAYRETGKQMSYPKDGASKSEFTPANLLSFTHKEDEYYDFNNEKIIPYQVSKLGPAIAVGDIDGNGYADIYIGNASGYAGQLFLNDGAIFSPSAQNQFELDAQFEDNAAAFFDADGDGDLDLYVGSGINRVRNKNYEMDRLYLNENGQFTRSKDGIFTNILNTSAVAPYDYDQDGDVDLFIGNLSDPGHFGNTVNAAILKNDGKGNFKTVEQNFSLKSFVTSAHWIDINGDNQKDLLISTEWDAPKIYLNQNGVLSPIEVPEKLNGLWESITAFDIDKDGDQDILLGNWGLNTKFNPSEESPLMMYFGDFDDDGNTETVLAYTKNGKEYPVNSKDELASQMNVIRKRFVEHKDYALKTIEEVLTPEALKKAKKYSVYTLASGYLENNNGRFSEFKPFPKEFQLAPIHSFDSITLDGENALIVSGNSLSMNTYHGGYTSLKGLFLRSISDYDWVSDYGMAPFNNQIKGVKTIKMKNGKTAVLVIPDDDPVQTYLFKN